MNVFKKILQLFNDCLNRNTNKNNEASKKEVNNTSYEFTNVSTVNKSTTSLTNKKDPDDAYHLLIDDIYNRICLAMQKNYSSTKIRIYNRTKTEIASIGNIIGKRINVETKFYIKKVPANEGLKIYYLVITFKRDENGNYIYKDSQS